MEVRISFQEGNGSLYSVDVTRSKQGHTTGQAARKRKLIVSFEVSSDSRKTLSFFRASCA
jgi:hypothetical protein